MPARILIKNFNKLVLPTTVSRSSPFYLNLHLRPRQSSTGSTVFSALSRQHFIHCDPWKYPNLPFNPLSVDYWIFPLPLRLIPLFTAPHPPGLKPFTFSPLAAGHLPPISCASLNRSGVKELEQAPRESSCVYKCFLLPPLFPSILF